MRQAQADLADESGWTEVRNARGIRTAYRHDPAASALHSVKMATTVTDASLVALLAVFYEAQLHTTWLPTYRFCGVRSSERLAQPRPAQVALEFLAGEGLLVLIKWPADAGPHAGVAAVAVCGARPGL